MFFNIFTEYNHHHIILKHLPYPEEKYLLATVPTPPPLALGNHHGCIHLPVCINLSIPDISYKCSKWNHTLCGLPLPSIIFFARFINVVACISTLFLFIKK